MWSRSNTPGPAPFRKINASGLGRVLAATLLLGQAHATSSSVSGVAPSVDWSHVRQAFRAAESWVTTAAVPDVAALEPIHVGRLVGARVTLRWAGRTMGSGASYTPDENNDRPNDLLASVRTAVDLAFQQVDQTLRAHHVRALARGGDATPPPKMRRDIASYLNLDLQVGYRLERLALHRTAGTVELLRAFAPGFQGLYLRTTRLAATTDRAWIWPGSTLAINLRPEGQLRRIMKDVGYGHEELKHVGHLDELTFARFDVIQYVRPGSDLPATRLVRGNELLPLRALTERDVESAARRMAEHILRRQREDGSFMGTYLPTSHRFIPPTAPASESALAAYAMVRRLAHLGRKGAAAMYEPDPKHLQSLEDCIGRSIDYLVPELVNPQRPFDPAASALMIMTLLLDPEGVAHKQQRNALATRIQAMAAEDGSFRGSDLPSARAVKPSTQALILAALSRLYEQHRNERLRALLLHGHRWLWQTTDANRLVLTLPWSLMTERTLHRSAGKARDDLLAHLDQFRALKQAILAVQVVEPPALGPPDVMGGFDLTGSGPGQPPAPNWRSAVMLAFLAIMLRDEGATDAPGPLEDMISCGLAARFLAQLTVDDPACYYAIQRELMVGGVRSALWDNRLPLDRTAMALLAMTELQESLRTIADGITEKD